MSSTFYYYIDPSCDAKCKKATGKHFSVYMKRAQHWASRALARLGDPRDADFARVFNIIMKTPKSDKEQLARAGQWQGIRRGGFQPVEEWQTTAQHVCRDLAVFAKSFHPTNDRRAAHVRFFSDNRRRWQFIPGRNGHAVPFDPVNHLLYQGDWAALADGQAARTGLRPEWEVPAGENPRRWVIDFGDSFWEGVEDEGMFVAKCDSLSRVPINDLIVSSVPRVIFHEVMHAPPFYMDDVPLNGETCTWEVVMNSKKGEAHTNAESMAVLGMWAWLADTRPAGRSKGGYSLDRNWDRIPGSGEDLHCDFDEDDLEEEEKLAGVAVGQRSQKWVAFKGNHAVQGIMVPYADLTRAI